MENKEKPAYTESEKLLRLECLKLARVEYSGQSSLPSPRIAEEFYEWVTNPAYEHPNQPTVTDWINGVKPYGERA
ncbi:hypothetical protein SAMN05421780_104284 [Flexibacter flexilis DSM 6793]|uniref:Uncharacterized protein n=1 Tax=Flexibacter flexilis DSM 6793 TaxID=927664 RepID=A0A1I1IBI4_9BACT|nr:hypothetical protein [Flexibacter flexilis]SFC33112.1 hypothetical protein SAMN05421780_104284 [Flexibacter flexilis DSM 6793]